eukprot:TCALIF_04055-PA protein Name:"Protein of unknown function" AED:0.03 eAED:0.03 QI:600/0.85/0.87/1/0.57/0.5/8/4071/163
MPVAASPKPVRHASGSASAISEAGNPRKRPHPSSSTSTTVSTQVGGAVRRNSPVQWPNLYPNGQTNDHPRLLHQTRPRSRYSSMQSPIFGLKPLPWTWARWFAFAWELPGWRQCWRLGSIGLCSSLEQWAPSSSPPSPPSSPSHGSIRTPPPSSDIEESRFPE